jgi:cytochrome c oxidase assembly protein subunit 15
VYFEFIHRALAGLISIVTAVLSVMLFRHKKISKSIKFVALAAIFILAIQIVLGGLTVLWQLHDKVVTAHLALGTAFFSLTLWVYWSLSFHFKSENLNFKISKNNNAHKALIPGIILLIFIYAQLLLGGQVASNYAALACPEFPLCFGEFIPTLSGSIGLNVMHRLGAYILVFVVSGVYLYINKVVDNFMIRKIAAFSVAALMFQILLGVLNIEFFIPPLITVLHSATATILLGLAVSMIRFSTFNQLANTEVISVVKN